MPDSSAAKVDKALKASRVWRHLSPALRPGKTRDDEAVDINGYKPTNFGGKSYGTLTLAEALAHSVNTITVKPGAGSGGAQCRHRRPARRHHVTAPSQCFLGAGHHEVTPLELTAAYAAFANGGYRVSPYWSPKWISGQAHLSASRTAAIARDRPERGP